MSTMRSRRLPLRRGDAVDKMAAPAPCRTNLSPVEWRILDCLQANARISNADLAAAVGLSASPCWRKVRSLEERGIITQYSALINPAVLGYTVEASLLVSLDRNATADREIFESEVGDVPGVNEIQLVTGEADYLLRIFAESNDALGRTISSIGAIRGVRHVRSNIVLSSARSSNIGAEILPFNSRAGAA